MGQFIARYGIAAIFVGTAIEGDVTMVLAGVTAHLGLVGLPAALLAGAGGGFAGDAAWYWLGRRHGPAFRRTRMYQRVAPAIEKVAARIGPLQIAVARFVYGTRIATMLLWGLRGLRAWRFAAMDLPGCALWAIILGTFGYLMSDSAAAFVGEVKRVEIWLLGALGATLVLMLAFREFWRRRVVRAEPPSGRE